MWIKKVNDRSREERSCRHVIVFLMGLENEKRKGRGGIKVKEVIFFFVIVKKYCIGRGNVGKS